MERHAHHRAERQESNVMAQFAQSAREILRTEGIAGLSKRIAGRLNRRPLHIRGYIFALHLDRPIRVPSPTIEMETSEVKATDEDTLAQLAQVDNDWKASEAQLYSRLRQGHRCYVARCQGQVVAAQWFLEGEFDSIFLGRRFLLTANEIYGYNTFTVPAFRGKGINTCLTAKSARSIQACSPHKTRLLALINATNKASLRSIARLGFTRIGRVGFIEVFGIRLHYLLGRNALPATARRFFFEKM